MNVFLDTRPVNAANGRVARSKMLALFNPDADVRSQWSSTRGVLLPGQRPGMVFGR